eukprot:CAMPEP_0183316366 /NCGR_PEP_ID=MMETSP0160_2-20130417/54722_1 /TAXON_ID=2839 ORGANISM="Odontella Sinensis, Strain Grunow 1884" /NCGR_SAMPLE_ID=MMETSP0160_2 /ASSEMBLY_ACC=CAM_ASM_000250 /LENGTH=38 /DNA_ID= /DNA_START= /DNA_END= /DNA_ORIENTATION=
MAAEGRRQAEGRRKAEGAPLSTTTTASPRSDMGSHPRL